jgi:hypothetical protein
LDRFVVILSAPEAIMFDPIFHRLESMLGVSKPNSELVARSDGVDLFLKGLAWSAFLAYWFIIGIAVRGAFILVLIYRRRSTQCP